MAAEEILITGAIAIEGSGGIAANGDGEPNTRTDIELAAPLPANPTPNTLTKHEVALFRALHPRATLAEIAEHFDIGERTLSEWANHDDEYRSLFAGVCEQMMRGAVEDVLAQFAPVNVRLAHKLVELALQDRDIRTARQAIVDIFRLQGLDRGVAPAVPEEIRGVQRAMLAAIQGGRAKMTATERVITVETTPEEKG